MGISQSQLSGTHFRKSHFRAALSELEKESAIIRMGLVISEVERHVLTGLVSSPGWSPLCLVAHVHGKPGKVFRESRYSGNGTDQLGRRRKCCSRDMPMLSCNFIYPESCAGYVFPLQLQLSRTKPETQKLVESY